MGLSYTSARATIVDEIEAAVQVVECQFTEIATFKTLENLVRNSGVSA